MQISRLARSLGTQKKCIVVLQVRKITTPKQYPAEPRALFHGLETTVLDRGIGVKSDPRMLLDLKPLEWRTNAHKTYFEHIGVVVVTYIAVFVFLLVVISMGWLNYADVTVSIRRQDLARFLNIKDGRDYQWLATNPFFSVFTPCGPATFQLRSLFYHEIEDALERRKQQDALSSGDHVKRDEIVNDVKGILKERIKKE